MKIEDKLLTIGSVHGRSGRALKPQGIVIHYVGNPGSSAIANRNYFETGGSYASAHYIVGLNGEIIRCVPDNECAAHAGKAYDTKYTAMAATNNSKFIGIENCHQTADGKFNAATESALVELVAYLCKRYNLNPNKDVYRHYDVCGKICPFYHVKNPEVWVQLKSRFVLKYNELMSSPATETPAAAPAETVAPPSSWAADAWVWATQHGITDGSNARATVTREQSITFIYHLYQLLSKEKSI